MCASPTVEHLERQIVDVLRRFGQLAAILQVLTEKLEAGDARAAKLEQWVKLASDNSLSAMNGIQGIRKEMLRDTANELQMAEVLNSAVERGCSAHERIDALDKRIASVEEIFGLASKKWTSIQAALMLFFVGWFSKATGER